MIVKPHDTFCFDVMVYDTIIITVSLGFCMRKLLDLFRYEIHGKPNDIYVPRSQTMYSGGLG